MQPSHIALLALSCVAVGVLLSIVVQHRLAGAKASNASVDEPSIAATVLNPSTFSGNKIKLAPTVASDPKQPKETPRVDQPVVSKAPPGSGERWTPIK